MYVRRNILIEEAYLYRHSDSRIPALIRNGAQEKKRSFFVVVGDRQKDVIVNLYHILLNVDVKLNKSVLWAYKSKLLGFSRCGKGRY
jgi:N-acetyltransferase 10